MYMNSNAYFCDNFILSKFNLKEKLKFNKLKWYITKIRKISYYYIPYNKISLLFDKKK